MNYLTKNNTKINYVMRLWSQGGDVTHFFIFGCERHIRKCANIIIIIPGVSLFDVIAYEDASSMWNIRLDEAGLIFDQLVIASLNLGSSHHTSLPHAYQVLKKHRLPDV